MKTATDIIKALGGEVQLAKDLGFQHFLQPGFKLASKRHSAPSLAEVVDLARAKNVDLTFEMLVEAEPAAKSCMKAAAFYLAVAGAYAGAVSIALTAWAAFHGWHFRA